MSQENQSLEIFKERLDKTVKAYQHPEERRIGYGNLRHEYNEWSRGETRETNVAVIYETPGGSTTQINVTYVSEAGEFVFLDDDLETQISTKDPEEALAFIEKHLKVIPEKRCSQLEMSIDSWMFQGKGKSEICSELNKLLQTEFLGGRINNKELKHGIQHLVKQFAKASN